MGNIPTSALPVCSRGVRLFAPFQGRQVLYRGAYRHGRVTGGRDGKIVTMVAIAGAALLAGFTALAWNVVSKDRRLQEAWKDSQATPALVALIAFAIGSVFGGGASLALHTDDGVWYAAGLGMALLAFFHWSEFFLQAVYRH